MKGKQILESVYGITFPKDNYMATMDKIDAQGMVGRKQTNTILVRLCEQLDILSEEVEALKVSKESDVGTKRKTN